MFDGVKKTPLVVFNNSIYLLKNILHIHGNIKLLYYFKPPFLLNYLPSLSHRDMTLQKRLGFGVMWEGFTQKLEKLHNYLFTSFWCPPVNIYLIIINNRNTWKNTRKRCEIRSPLRFFTPFSSFYYCFEQVSACWVYSVRDVFRTLLNIYDKVFLSKQLTASSR